MANNRNNRYVVWQWNCRGFRRKRGNLDQFILNKGIEERPDVICLQETGNPAKLPNYKTFSQESEPSSSDRNKKPVVATLIKRNLPVIQHDTGIEAIDHVLVEIIPTKKRGEGSLFILNVYSNPRSNHRFA